MFLIRIRMFLGLPDRHPHPIVTRTDPEPDPYLFSVLRIRAVYPGSGTWFLHIPDPRSRIPDLGSKNSNKREGWKKICCPFSFFIAKNYTKLKIILFLKSWRKKFGPIFTDRIIELFTQKMSLSSQNFGFGIRYPGSKIRDPEKTFSGSRSQKGTGSWIPDPDPQHCGVSR